MTPGGLKVNLLNSPSCYPSNPECYVARVSGSLLPDCCLVEDTAEWLGASPAFFLLRVNRQVAQDKPRLLSWGALADGAFVDLLEVGSLLEH